MSQSQPPFDPSQPPYDPQRYGQYAPPAEMWAQPQAAAPAVPGAWYGMIAFNICMILVGLYFSGLGIACRMAPQFILDTQQRQGSQMSSGVRTVDDVLQAGILFLILGVIMTLVPAAMFFIPRSPAKWFYGLIVLATGILGCFCSPFALVMIFFWLLPATRDYFWQTGPLTYNMPR